MKSSTSQAARPLIVGLLMLLLPGSIHAWEPNAADLEAAVNRGDFTEYFGNVWTWLNQKTPDDAARISRGDLEALLKNPDFAKALSQRQFIAKAGADNLAAFAKADPSNKTFLASILRTTEAMENCLEGVTPVGLNRIFPSGNIGRLYRPTHRTRIWPGPEKWSARGGPI